MEVHAQWLRSTLGSPGAYRGIGHLQSRKPYYDFIPNLGNDVVIVQKLIFILLKTLARAGPTASDLDERV